MCERETALRGTVEGKFQSNNIETNTRKPMLGSIPDTWGNAKRKNSPLHKISHYILNALFVWMLFPMLKQILLSLLPNGSDFVLWANLFPTSSAMTTYFKIVILSSSLIFRLKKKILDSFSSLSWDMSFSCFTFSLSLLWMCSVWITVPLKRITRTETVWQVWYTEDHYFLWPQFVFFPYNIADKIGSFQSLT